MPYLSSLRAIAALSLLHAAATAQQDAVRIRFTDLVVPLADAAAERAEIVLRVVDGITGQPIANAEAFTLPENEHPLPGVLAFAARAVSDAFGIVRLPTKSGWIMVRAAGYGPAMNSDQSDRVVPLAPALDVPVRIEDWRGVPLAGYLVGFCGGCGHTPDLVNAVSDGDGIAWLRGIDPGNGIADLYVADAPIDFAYDDITWEPGAPPDRHRFARGVVVHGVVLQPDGSPAAGAILGLSARHRGPWTRADADGHFVLGGLTTGDSFLVVHGDRRIDFQIPERLPCTLQLPVPNGEADVEGDPLPRGPTGIVRYTLTPPAGWVVEDQRVLAFGPLPEFARVQRPQEPEGELQLLAGRHELRVSAAGLREQRRTVDVAPGVVTEIAFELTALPTATIAVAGLPRDATVELVSEVAVADITAAVRDGTPVAIDPAVDYCLRLDTEHAERCYAVTGRSLLHGAGRFAWYAPTRITAAIVDDAGAPTGAAVAFVPDLPCLDVDGLPKSGFDPRGLATSPCHGTVTLQTATTGLGWLFVRPDDTALHPRLVPVPLPWRGDDAHVDLGRIALSRRPQLRLLAADGTPLRRGIALLRPGRSDFRERCFRIAALAEDGSWLGPDLRAGDGVLLPTDDEPAPGPAGVPTVDLPFRAVLDDTPSRELRLPSGSLHLHVDGADGAPIAKATVLLADSMWPLSAELAIRQLPAGQHRLLLGAAGHRTAIVEVTLEDGEHRELRLVLPQR